MRQGRCRRSAAQRPAGLGTGSSAAARVDAPRGAAKHTTAARRAAPSATRCCRAPRAPRVRASQPAWPQSSCSAGALAARQKHSAGSDACAFSSSPRALQRYLPAAAVCTLYRLCALSLTGSLRLRLRLRLTGAAGLEGPKSRPAAGAPLSCEVCLARRAPRACSGRPQAPRASVRPRDRMLPRLRSAPAADKRCDGEMLLVRTPPSLPQRHGCGLACRLAVLRGEKRRDREAALRRRRRQTQTSDSPRRRMSRAELIAGLPSVRRMPRRVNVNFAGVGEEETRRDTSPLQERESSSGRRLMLLLQWDEEEQGSKPAEAGQANAERRGGASCIQHPCGAADGCCWRLLHLPAASCTPQPDMRAGGRERRQRRASAGPHADDPKA